MMNPPPDFVYWLLWAAAGLAAAWVLLPKALAALGLTRCGVVVGGPDDLQPTGDDPQYEDLFETLTRLGFTPLGTKVEIGWFLPHRWRRVGLPGRIFATAERDCFASLYRLFEGDRWHVAFCTVFTDDSLVMTSDHMAGLRIEQEGYLRWGFPSSDLAEVLREHRQTAENYAAADARTVDHPGLEGISEAIRYHSERYLRRRGPALAAKGLPNALFLLAAPPALVAAWLGVHSPAVPAAVVLGAMCYTAFVPLAVRTGTQKIRQRDQARALERQWAKRRKEGRAPRPSAAPASDGVTPAAPLPDVEDRYRAGGRP